VKEAGVESIAVVLKHAALFPDHEQTVGAIAQEMGFKHVSLSHQVMPMVKMVARGFTAAADAYLTPHILKYLQTFRSGFDEGLAHVDLAFMQSDGGLSPADSFSGHKAILSGPAAGYVGYAATTKWENMKEAVPLQACCLSAQCMHRDVISGAWGLLLALHQHQGEASCTCRLLDSIWVAHRLMSLDITVLWSTCWKAPLQVSQSKRLSWISTQSQQVEAPACSIATGRKVAVWL
jgi:hypothetical protein